MSWAESGFMPHLSEVKRSNFHHMNNKKCTQAPLPHTVLTFGSPYNENMCVPFNHLIEGTRTGEEYVKANGVVGGKRLSKEQGASEGEKKLQQVSIELQQALERLRQKNKEELKLRRKSMVTRLKLEEEIARRELLVNGLLNFVQIHWDFQQKQSAHLQYLLRRIAVERDRALCALEGERTRTALQEKERQEWSVASSENNTLRQELKGLQEEILKLKKSCKELRKEKEENEELSMGIRHKLETDLMRTQVELQKVNNELKESQCALSAIDLQVQQVRLFVQMVCQPNFSVVKDSSLQPVNKNRPEPTGFVLVPLTVLLQGYTLLPLSDRQHLVESYEAHLA